MEKDKISVIVPIYNIEKYIYRCINSILNQTYENLEIILVNDGSTDMCPKICDEYQKRDSRICVIHKENGGLSSARNAGLDVAHGEYIAFIDGDDYIDPHMLENLYFELIKSQADFSVCNVQYVDEYGEKLIQYPDDYLKYEVLDANEVFLKSLEQYGYYLVVVWNKLYKRALWNKYRFPETRYHEDEFSFHPVLEQCKKIVCIKEACYFYVQHEGSIMSIPSITKIFDALEAFIERMQFFQKSQMTDCLVIQDIKTFWFIQEGYRLCKSKQDRIQYQRIKNRYYELHNYIIRNYDYPKRARIKIAIFRFFPCSKKLYRVIKPVLKTLKYQIIRFAVTYKAYRFRPENSRQKRIWFISTPTHGNLGDQAIVYAQYNLLKEIGIHKNIIEITRSAYENLRNKLEKIIRPEDLILIDGGGNLGTLWIEEEKKMRDIVCRFLQNPIFIFPQTAFYKDDKYGRQELKNSAAVYNKHPNLTIFCRDSVTFQLVQSEFTSVKSIYTPDMVPFIRNAEKETRRNGILLCLRDDLESVHKKAFKSELIARLTARGFSVREISTLVGKKVIKATRKRELRKKWNEISAAELVITDRLHGMIFAAITGTPCLALDNISHKVRDGYEWLKYLPYLAFCEGTAEEIAVKAEAQIKKRRRFYYDRTPLEPYYEKIKKEVQDAFEK